MKTFFIRNKETLVVVILYLISLWAFYYYEIIDEKVLIGVLAVITSLYFGVLKNNIENDKIFRELFKEFNIKYEKDFREVLMNIESNYEMNKEYKLTKVEWASAVQYLNFCAEEYLWYSRGRIAKSVWSSWKVGIEYYLKLAPVMEVVKQELIQKGSYYGLFKEMGFTNPLSRLK